MTDPELVEQIALAIEDLTEVRLTSVELASFGRSVIPLIASREAAAADKRQAEIVEWLRCEGCLYGSSRWWFRASADAIESGAFRTGEG